MQTWSKNPLPAQALATVLKYVLVKRSTCFLSLQTKRLLIWFLSMQIRLLTRNTSIGPYATLGLGVSSSLTTVSGAVKDCIRPRTKVQQAFLSIIGASLTTHAWYPWPCQWMINTQMNLQLQC